MQSSQPPAAVEQIIQEGPAAVRNARDALAAHDDRALEAQFDHLEPIVVRATKETKAGYKTTEFWLTIIGVLFTQVGALDLPGKYGKTIQTVALVAAYILSRGIAKAGVPTVDDSDPVE